jgi:[ribosomal protein S5]-alanine N-acetyltransferase
VIIWLNGPFGVGKTSTARALARRLPGALLYDPEPFGAALRAVVAPVESADDFQELRAWPTLVLRTAAVLHEVYSGVLVIPMTVLDPGRVGTLTNGLRAIDRDLHRFQLVASEAVLRERILGRPEAEGPHAWCLEHLEAGLKLGEDARFGEAIVTDHLLPDRLAEVIVQRVANARHPRPTADAPVVLPRPRLVGRHVVLRAPRPTDRADRAHWGARAEIVRMYGGDPVRATPPALSAEAVERWYRQVADDELCWVIQVGDRCVGQVRLHQVEPANRRARLAIGLFAPELFDHGYGTEATRLVLRHAFDGLGLHRVDLRVLDVNTRAIRCYEKCGFVREGVERASVRVGGAWVSDVLMSILEDEYRHVERAWGRDA